MKKSKKLVAMLLALVCLITGSVTAFAATGTNANTESTAAVGTKVFDGYKVTVLDKTTPATNIRGRVNDRNVMCFVSAADKEVGTISYTDYNALIQKYRKVVNLPDGGTWGAPPVEGKSWEDWFADEFNKYRSLDVGLREIAVAENRAQVIEEYRNKLVELVNAEREKVGLEPYIVDEDCMAYSQVRAEELVTLFGHTRPDGTDAGYEVIAIVSEDTPEGAVDAWMKSPGHKAALLNEGRKYVGAGVYITSTGGCYWQMYFERDPDVYANTKIMGK